MDTIDAELRAMLDRGERERQREQHDRATRLAIIMCGATIAGIFLLAALVVLVAGGAQ